MDDISLSIYVIDFVNKFISLDSNQQCHFIFLLKREYDAFDDEYLIIFDKLIKYLENSLTFNLSLNKKKEYLEYKLYKLIDNIQIDNYKIELLIKSSIDYYSFIYSNNNTIN